MLAEFLHTIIDKVEQLAKLEDALQFIVDSLQKGVGCNVASIYLYDENAEQLVMVATHGLRKEAVGQIKMALDEGVVGLVAQRAEPINLDNAPKHHRYAFYPESGEEGLKSFLGVPLISQRETIGVLCLQQQQGKFTDECVSTMITFAALLAKVMIRFDGLQELWPQHHNRVERRILHGLNSAPGIAIGKAVVVDSELDLASITDSPVVDTDAELARFYSAIAAVQDDLLLMQSNIATSLSASDQELFNAYLLILQGRSFSGEMEQEIKNGSGAMAAVRDVVVRHMEVFQQMSDPYLRERGQDIYELGRRVVARLALDSPDRVSYPRNTILFADEITAAMMAEVPAKRLRGVVSLQGSKTSHSAILAKALNIPAVLGVTNLPLHRLSGMEVAIDGETGEVFLSPNSETKKRLRNKQEQNEIATSRFETIRTLPATTLDDHTVQLYVNSGLSADVDNVLHSGAEGVGLYRTEFPFMANDRFPGEEEQRKIYRKILLGFAPLPVTMRTLDVGGDKPLPYFPIDESNPFLGWRGIRFTLDHPDIFLMQLRAMMRANIGCNNLRILLPMITDVTELDLALTLIQQAYSEVAEEYADVVMPLVGAMIEVPAAVYQARQIARRTDFLSIGSNDLTQYLLAVDRNNSRVSGLYDSFHPAVLQALAQVVQAAKLENREVSVCGEMAGDPAAALLLMGLGIHALSMNVSAIPGVKEAIRSANMSQLQLVAANLLHAESSSEVVEQLSLVRGKVLH